MSLQSCRGMYLISLFIVITIISGFYPPKLLNSVPLQIVRLKVWTKLHYRLQSKEIKSHVLDM